MKIILLLISFIFIFNVNTNAQRHCSSSEYAKLNKEVSYREISGNTSNAAARDTFSNEVITIPVVIHVLYNTSAQNISDGQILSQLKALNDDFRRLNADAVNTPAAFKSFASDTRIEFCLAQVNPQGKPASGIIRKYTNKVGFSLDDAMKFSGLGGDDAWDTKSYLNIWVCNFSGQALGYSSFPGGQADKDGVVIQYDVFGTTSKVRPVFNKGRTTTHEVGHWLGLKHIWGDNSCGSDGIEDTPQQSGNNYNCPSFPHMSSCSPNANGDMFMNYMDYTNDDCMNLFTTGQAIKMRGLFSLNGRRNSFLNSVKCDSTLKSGGALPTEPATKPATITENKPAADVQIYPNPVNQFLNLVAINGFELTGKFITLSNVSGSVVLQKRIASNTDKVNVSSLARGVYVLTITDGKDKKVLKLVKL